MRKNEILLLEENGWTVVTANGRNAAHEEHTIIVHKDYAEIITI